MFLDCSCTNIEAYSMLLIRFHCLNVSLSFMLSIARYLLPVGTSAWTHVYMHWYAFIVLRICSPIDPL